jgi:hypothetical protein
MFFALGVALRHMAASRCNNKCPACRGAVSVPVSTPVGMRLAKELGPTLGQCVSAVRPVKAAVVRQALDPISAEVEAEDRAAFHARS